ncbi:MAG: hypothetical protein A2Z99_20765 [Treponema sp. GWB1_62_6]|nr:MAG: hypothetical protein A2Z99_20765 [Treponema sp. GWB1_62_6]OHE64424.1 MAG: hypothetical protein A2001_02050 [Treponema sp. GWC1_61_84]
MNSFSKWTARAFLVSVISVLALAGAASAFAESSIILPRDAVWKYDDSGKDLGSGWRSADFADAAWKRGKAPLGFGDDVSETDPTLPIGTVVGYGPNADNKNMTTYLRTEVAAGSLAGFDSLSVYVHADDGAVVYINGVEVIRRGIAAGIAVSYSTGAKFKPKEETITLPVSVLKEGLNLIAAEVHQDDGSSSDLWFELGIQAVSSSAGATSTTTGAVAIRVPDPSAPLGKVAKAVATVYGDTRSEMGFTWYTTAASDGSDVQIVEKTMSVPDFSKAKNFTGTWALPANSPKEVLHKGEAVGLTPGTAYWYRVGDASRKLWSDAGAFSTAPKTGAFTFIDLADPQAKNEDEAVLASRTLAAATAIFKDAAFMAINGDLVDVGMMEQQWDWLFGHSRETLRALPLVPLAGNHDEDKSSFIDHFNLKVPRGSATVSGAYYSFDWSNAHFIVLNTNEDSPEWADLTPAQVDWFVSDAKAAKKAGAGWIVVFLHKGPYTTSNHATDGDMTAANGVRTKFAPLLDDLGIDLVFQGHDHIYARSLPIVDGSASATRTTTETVAGTRFELLQNPKGPVYVIPATAGPKTYYRNKKIDPSFFKLFAVADENHAARHGPDKADPSRPLRGAVQNFMGVTIDGKTLTATVYEIDATLNGGKPFIVDRFGIRK